MIQVTIKRRVIQENPSPLSQSNLTNYWKMGRGTSEIGFHKPLHGKEHGAKFCMKKATTAMLQTVIKVKGHFRKRYMSPFMAFWNAAPLL